LDWLIDHKEVFELLVRDKLIKKIDINWDDPRLIIVAKSYNEYDKYAVNRISDNIELWRYVLYKDDTILVEKLPLPKEKEKSVGVKANSSWSFNGFHNFKEEEFKEILKDKKIKLGVDVIHTFGKLKKIGYMDFSSDYLDL